MVTGIPLIECAQISSLTQFLFVGSSVFELTSSTPKILLPIVVLLFWPAFL
jgi:hypothetical protein